MADAGSLLPSAASRVWEAACSSSGASDPSLLCQLLLLCYGDLKRHTFTYWAAFPSVALPVPATLAAPAAAVGAVLSSEEALAVSAACDEGVGGLGGTGCGPPSAWLVHLTKVTPIRAAVAPLSAWGRLAAEVTVVAEGGGSQELLLAFRDPSSLPVRWV